MTLEVAIDHRQGNFRLQAEFASDGRLTALFGRSGAGKTTLVNIIAGLLRPDMGRVVLGGEVLVDTSQRIFVPPHRRRIGYVFQEGRLFPHLTVRRNLLYGRWFAPKTVAEDSRRAGRFDDVVALLGLGKLLDRLPAGLSGGEKQRVAIGRALLANPRLLLMDEPLASLDEARKQEILPYLEQLRDAAGVPIVYVSHAMVEVARLATSLVALADGHVIAAGPVEQVMGRLGLAAAIGRAEAGALLDLHVAAVDDGYGLTLLRSPAGELRVPRLDVPEDAVARIQILARDVIVGLRPPEALSALNVLQGTIAEIGAADGAVVELRIDCAGSAILAQITRRSLDMLGLKVGQPVYAIVKSVTFAGRA